MPGFDRTGPEGQGPRTGRAMGKCNPDKENTVEDTNREYFGRGRGFARRLNLGFGRKYGRGQGRRGGAGRRMGRGGQ